MIVNFGPTRIEETLAGDEVSSRTVQFGNQAEQVQFLRKMVDEYRTVAAIRARARDIVFRQYMSIPKDPLAHALAIGEWVQQNITYVNETPEVFQTPTHTVATGYGDCDDFTTLICALCESIGIETELVALEWGGAFRHIFPRALIKRGGIVYRVPLDATLPYPVRLQTDPVQIALRRRYNLRVYIA